MFKIAMLSLLFTVGSAGKTCDVCVAHKVAQPVKVVLSNVVESQPVQKMVSVVAQPVKKVASCVKQRPRLLFRKWRR